jgi:Protein of unknown function (DUF2510)
MPGPSCPGVEVVRSTRRRQSFDPCWCEGLLDAALWPAGLSFAEVVSSGELIALLVLGVVFAVLGYWLSENDRRRFGRTPWGLPSLVWALFWFLSILLGFILYLIAHADVVRRARQFPEGRFPAGGPYRAGSGSLGMGTAPPPTPSVADQFPAYPRPAGGPAIGPSVEPAVAPATAPVDELAGPQPGPSSGPIHHPGPAEGPSGYPMAAQPTPATPVSPPAWHPDPGGRFHYRWWDGSQWTSFVSFNGQQLIDTSPDQRIGPY